MNRNASNTFRQIIMFIKMSFCTIVLILLLDMTFIKRCFLLPTNCIYVLCRIYGFQKQQSEKCSVFLLTQNTNGLDTGKIKTFGEIQDLTQLFLTQLEMASILLLQTSLVVFKTPSKPAKNLYFVSWRKSIRFSSIPAPWDASQISRIKCQMIENSELRQLFISPKGRRRRQILYIQCFMLF